ncbi:MAG: lysophospholipid acyltransferase family protein [Crocinitomicaceae bacterium]|nr:lysophospholipid acyltransferase family protein [Crocinitomicaceae bacterium]MDG1659562.1 lysophospholipid acyltransferase family protein [Crocinitomicaceae bacterium]
MRKFAAFILRLFGWKIDRRSPEGVKKCVVVVAPHTSNWDFIIGKLAFRSYGVKAKFLIKKELFFFPLGWIMKGMGGIPVDRKANNNLTESAVQHFQENDTMFMLFTPEGTRSYSPNWKKGFYYIAKKAEVPIYLGYIDYKNKTGGFYGFFETTGNAKDDIMSIKKILHHYKGRFPENGIRDEEIE